MAKPKINTKAVASSYSSPNERIVEVSDNGALQSYAGCLISVRNDLLNDRLVIDVYSVEPGRVEVRVAKGAHG